MTQRCIFIAGHPAGPGAVRGAGAPVAAVDARGLPQPDVPGHRASVTNPLILPLRRVLPPIGKVDTASVVAVLLVAIVKVGSQFWLADLPLPPPALAWASAVVDRDRAHAAVDLLLRDLAVRAAQHDRPGRLLAPAIAARLLCEPVLRPIRRIIPPLSGLDLSPLWAGIAIQALLILLR